MKRLNDLELLRLSKFRRFLYKLVLFFISIPKAIWSLIKKIGKFFKNLGIKTKDTIVFIGKTFKNGSWKTKLSYFLMGFGNISRGQWAKGLLFLIFEIVFIVYMITTGGYWLSKFGTLGTLKAGEVEIDGEFVMVAGDQSFKILLYGLLTIIFIFTFIITWYLNVKQNAICEQIEKEGKKVKSNKEDLKSLLDDNFHKTLLTLPILGVIGFTIIPIIFMVLVAFTSYDAAHDGYSNLFTWVGFDNFNALLGFSNANGDNFSLAFGEILSWTLIWAVFATFTNYFLGMLVAMMINKKGIRGKKIFRTIMVLSIAVPQFVSLLYVSNMFETTGLINTILVDWKIIDAEHLVPFWQNATLARVMVILINIWIGIPYLMLITTGILMNIPQDLYESAKIDGANAWQQYTRITLPYMLFVTGPYLLTSFISNINNFNVIFLLTGGRPNNPDLTVGGKTAGSTDLLITWLYNLTGAGGDADYKLASVIGIIVFLIVALISLIVYNIMPSNRNERDFS